MVAVAGNRKPPTLVLAERNRAHFQLPRWRSVSPRKVRQPRGEKRAIVHTVIWQAVEQWNERCAVDDLDRAAEAGPFVRFVRVRLDRPELPAEVVAVLAEEGILGQDRELWSRVHDARCFDERRRNHGSGRVHGAHLIAVDRLDDRSAKPRRRVSGHLVDQAEE